MAHTLANAFLVLTLAAALGAEERSFEVELTSGETRVATAVRLRGGELELVGEDGGGSLDLGEVLLITARPGDEPSIPGRVDVLLLAPAAGREPARLAGLIAAGDEYGVTFALPATGSSRIPLETIERILPAVDDPLDRLVRLPGDPIDDRVWLRREDQGLDSLTGLVESIDGAAVRLDGALGLVEFTHDEAIAVVLAGSEPPPHTLEGAPVIVALAGGSRFEAGWLDADEERFLFSTAFAERLEVPADVVDQIVHRVDGLVLATERAPAAVDERPSLGTADEVLFPWRRELSVTGRTLRLREVECASGLGVHARSRLSFDVPDGAESFRVTVGVLDETAEIPAEATMTFALEAEDGAVLATSGTLRVEDGPVVLRADVGSLARLVLVADDAGDLDAGDRGVWAVPAFLGADRAAGVPAGSR